MCPECFRDTLLGGSDLLLGGASLDLNACDFALWKAVNRRMRKAERKFPRSKFESRQKYISRLQRTARNLPRIFISKIVGDMARRCKRLYARKGGPFRGRRADAVRSNLASSAGRNPPSRINPRVAWEYFACGRMGKGLSPKAGCLTG